MPLRVESEGSFNDTQSFLKRCMEGPITPAVLRMAEAGVTGAGIAKYYLMPEGLPFLNENAKAKKYPYSSPTASREYVYDETTCPNAHEFLDTFIRWSTFCEKYTEEDCELAAAIVRDVADRNRS